MKVYLDNAATTQVDSEVIKVMNQINRNNYGNPSSIHDFGKQANQELDKARKILAKKINAQPEEIIFTSGGTEADNLAIKGYLQLNNKKHIITSKFEHPAVLETCKDLEKQGYKIDYLSITKEGFINLKELEKKITKDTTLVTIMHANNEVGTIQDLKTIGKICKKYSIAFHTDAVQSFTKAPIDVKEMNLTFASFSSHKIHGPKGVGALYIKKGTRIKKQITGGSQENKLRAGTQNIAGIVGFAKAITLDPKLNQVKKLRNYLINKILKEIPNSTLNGSKERLANNANIRFKYIEGESILFSLNDKGIAVSTGSACSSDKLKPSHTLKAMELPQEEIHGAIRFTLSKYTTKEEIDYTIKHLKSTVERLRKISPLTK